MTSLSNSVIYCIIYLIKLNKKFHLIYTIYFCFQDHFNVNMQIRTFKDDSIFINDKRIRNISLLLFFKNSYFCSSILSISIFLIILFFRFCFWINKHYNMMMFKFLFWLSSIHEAQRVISWETDIDK
jgi:hypothetical protein